jgi:hypothetical protein
MACTAFKGYRTVTVLQLNLGSGEVIPFLTVAAFVLSTTLGIIKMEAQNNTSE